MAGNTLFNPEIDSHVCSRPTAVNLSDAAKTLTSLAKDQASLSNATSSSVAGRVIRAGKDMQHEDVKANKVKKGSSHNEWQ